MADHTLRPISSRRWERNVQLIVATHSPIFIRPETIRTVTRIFQREGFSRCTTLRSAELSTSRHLISMVQSHNNERMLFADRVILVEGITDRITFSSVFRVVLSHMRMHDAVEVIEVHGKGNFKQYAMLLRALEMPYVCVADLDFAVDLSENLRRLFVTDFVGIDERVLRDKRSRDRITLSEKLDLALGEGDLAKVADVWSYIKGRFLRIRDQLSETEGCELSKFISDQRGNDIYILRGGEIEDYLPRRDMSIDEIVGLVEDDGWLWTSIDLGRAQESIRIALSVLSLPTCCCEGGSGQARQLDLAYSQSFGKARRAHPWQPDRPLRQRASTSSGSRPSWANRPRKSKWL